MYDVSRQRLERRDGGRTTERITAQSIAHPAQLIESRAGVVVQPRGVAVGVAEVAAPPRSRRNSRASTPDARGRRNAPRSRRSCRGLRTTIIVIKSFAHRAVRRRCSRHRYSMIRRAIAIQASPMVSFSMRLAASKYTAPSLSLHCTQGIPELTDAKPRRILI